MTHIAVLHDVFFSFDTELSGVARACFPIEFDEIFCRDDLGANKRFFKIRVNDSGRLRSFCSALDGPGASLFFSGREVGNEVQRLVTFRDESIETGLFDPELSKKELLFFRGHIDKFTFDLDGDRK